ncbi:MAG: hypothetical protein ACI4OS_03585 [Akkermansia sp.]
MGNNTEQREKLTTTLISLLTDKGITNSWAQILVGAVTGALAAAAALLGFSL